jgi:hypothetical protein
MTYSKDAIFTNSFGNVLVELKKLDNQKTMLL